jgi:hypothetical protein
MSGLKFLYNLILKDVVKGSGQASGIMSIGKDIRKLADKKFQRYVTSAQKQGVDLDKLSEQELKYTLELNKPQRQKIISADSPEGKGITEMLLGKRGKVIKADFGKPFAEEIVTVERVITDIKKLEPIEAMKEANRVLKGEGRYKSLSKADREKIAMDESVTDHIFERNIESEDFAQGGRTGLSYLLAEDTNERMPFKMGRRAFLKLMGGIGAGIGAAKAGLGSLFKAGKPVTKTAEVITTPNAPGKPEWFDALITRVINEGDDVTKQFAYKERMRVHTKPISETEEVTVYRDLDDGSVRINYGSKLKIDDTKPYEKGNIQRASNDPDQVDLIVRQGEEIEPDLATGKGGGKTKSSFEASEAEPRAVGGPEDADIEFDGIREVNNVDDLMQDVSSLEEFATGKKLTGEKAAKAKKKREDFKNFLEDPVEQANYLEDKYGPAERYYGDPDDYASGGVAKMLGE